MGPGLLQPLLPAAPESRGLSAWAGSEGYSSQREVVSSVCWVSLCQASPVRTRRPQIFQAPVSQDTWGGCCPGAPRPTKPQEIQKPRARQNQAAVSLNGWAVGPRAPLSSSCCLTQRAASGLNVTSRRGGRGRAWAGHRPRFGWAGQLAQAPSLSPIRGSVSSGKNRLRDPEKQSSHPRQAGSKQPLPPARQPALPPASRFHLRSHPPSSQAPKA